MARRNKEKKAKQPPAKKYDLVIPEAERGGTKEGTEVYGLIDQAVKKHRKELAEARIGAAWMIGKKPDRDGHLLLGRMKVLNELEQQQLELDGIVLLNREHWRVFDRKQRLALVHHELCHMAPVLAIDGVEQALNGHGDRRWRKVKHDLEEFRAVVAAHGCYVDDLRQFARALMSKDPNLDLFEEKPPSVEPGVADRLAAAAAEDGAAN